MLPRTPILCLGQIPTPFIKLIARIVNGLYQLNSLSCNKISHKENDYSKAVVLFFFLVFTDSCVCRDSLNGQLCLHDECRG